MKAIRNIMIFFALVGFAIAWLYLRPAIARPAIPQAMVMQATQPMPSATSTPVPTATLDYGATQAVLKGNAVSAQGTADAYARLMVDATMKSQALTQESDIWTVTANAQAVLDGYSTQTAQAVYVPMTQTQEVAQRNEAIAAREYGRAQLTATAAAPTLIAAINQARIQERWGGWLAAAQVMGYLSLFVGSVSLFVFVARMNPPQVKAARYTSPAPTIRLHQGGPYPSMRELTPPCTHAQLIELAEKIVTVGALGYHNFEGSNSEWTRIDFKLMRLWLVEAGLAQEIPGREITLTQEGKDFFEHINTHGIPPPPYEEAAETDPPPANLTPVSEENTQKTSGGGDLLPIPTGADA